MLPCFGDAEGELRVQRRRSDYINDINVRIVGDSFQIVVAVDVLLLQVIICGPFLALFCMTGYNSREVALLCLA